MSNLFANFLDVDDKEWLARLNERFADIHKDPEEKPCRRTVREILYRSGFINYQGLESDDVVKVLGVMQDAADLADGDNKLWQIYHESTHVAEVTLCAAIITKRNPELDESFSCDMRLQLILASLCHDGNHPGKSNSESTIGQTEANSLLSRKKLLKAFPLKSDAIIVAVMATAYPFSINPEEIKQRIINNLDILKDLGIKEEAIPDMLTTENLLVAKVLCVADILPSLTSAERLGRGAMKLAIESGRLSIRLAVKMAKDFVEKMNEKADIIQDVTKAKINFDELLMNVGDTPVKFSMGKTLLRHPALHLALKFYWMLAHTPLQRLFSPSAKGTPAP